MKRHLLLISFFALISCSICSAQTEVKNSSVHSEEGFVVKKGSFRYGKKKHHYAGLYTADGKVCVRVWFYNNDVCVAPGTEEIFTGALAFSVSPAFPKSVKVIHVGAFTDANNFSPEIYDDSQITEHEIQE